MTRRKKEPRIIGKIKREVAKEKTRVEDQNKPISGDQGCSENNCSTYCSES